MQSSLQLTERSSAGSGVFTIIWRCLFSWQSRNTTMLAKECLFLTHWRAEVVFCMDGLYYSQDTGMGLRYEVINLHWLAGTLLPVLELD